jgi:hypothetical protein
LKVVAGVLEVPARPVKLKARTLTRAGQFTDGSRHLAALLRRGLQRCVAAQLGASHGRAEPMFPLNCRPLRSLCHLQLVQHGCAHVRRDGLARPLRRVPRRQQGQPLLQQSRRSHRHVIRHDLEHALGQVPPEGAHERGVIDLGRDRGAQADCGRVRADLGEGLGGFRMPRTRLPQEHVDAQPPAHAGEGVEDGGIEGLDGLAPTLQRRAPLPVVGEGRRTSTSPT